MQVNYSKTWLEVNTFSCPLGNHMTPEKCMRYRFWEESMPSECRSCTIYHQMWKEVKRRRQKLIEELAIEVEKRREELFQFKRKASKGLIKSETRKYRFTLLEKMLGTIPLNKTLYADYIASKYRIKEKTTPDTIKEQRIIEELELLIENEMTKGSTGFFKDERGVYIMDYHIKGFLKEAGNVLKDAIGIKNLRSKIDNYVFVYPRKIYIAPFPSGWLERPLRAMTMQGPRVSLARSEVVDEGISFEVEIEVLPNKEIDFDVIEKLLDYGCRKGLGQWRNGGYGTFLWFPGDK